ncbi:MAG: CBS domain-containing protein [Ignavibacteria bacterium]|nr:CBS domain-containing protein [Ignavibacteria bacterium]
MKTAEEILKEKNRDIITVQASAKVSEAVNVMNSNNIGAILVKKEGDIIGIWTERDLLKYSAMENFNPAEAVIGDYMVTNLLSAPYNANIYSLMDKFLGKRLRHLLIEKNGKYIGLLSAGDVIRAQLADKTEEIKDLNAMVGWEYYENWQ